MQVVAFDHVVLAVADVERSLRWYVRVLGLETVREEAWRAGEAPFPSLRVSEHTLIDLIRASRPSSAPNVDHICLVVQPTDLAAWAAESGLEILDGPSPRFGARGIATSIYISDPDSNVVELRHYG